jgi:hypothetical protein
MPTPPTMPELLRSCSLAGWLQRERTSARLVLKPLRDLPRALTLTLDIVDGAVVLAWHGSKQFDALHPTGLPPSRLLLTCSTPEDSLALDALLTRHLDFYVGNATIGQ